MDCLPEIISTPITGMPAGAFFFGAWQGQYRPAIRMVKLAKEAADACLLLPPDPSVSVEIHVCWAEDFEAAAGHMVPGARLTAKPATRGVLAPATLANTPGGAYFASNSRAGLRFSQAAGECFLADLQTGIIHHENRPGALSGISFLRWSIEAALPGGGTQELYRFRHPLML